MVWACASALAYLISGFLMEKFGGEILFWFSAALNVFQLALLPGLKKKDAQIAAAESMPSAAEIGRAHV